MQHAFDHHLIDWIIFHQQDRFVGAIMITGLILLAALFSLMAELQRNIEAKVRAFTFRTQSAQLTAHFLYKGTCYGQPQPGSTEAP